MNDKSEEEELAEGTLLSHLIELRSRLLIIAISVVVVFICMLPFSRDIFTVISEPLRDVRPGNAMIATAVASPLLTPFKLTFFAALFIVMPIVLFQIWTFIAPGLYKNEKRFAVPLFMTSVILFYLGISFAYFVVFPLMFSFFASVAPEGVEVQTDIAQFLDFITTIVFAFGIAFEVPIATVLVVWAGLTDTKKTWQSKAVCFFNGIYSGHVFDSA
jgi:sec-independent protein translocase protein TatC